MLQLPWAERQGRWPCWRHPEPLATELHESEVPQEPDRRRDVLGHQERERGDRHGAADRDRDHGGRGLVRDQLRAELRGQVSATHSVFHEGRHSAGAPALRAFDSRFPLPLRFPLPTEGEGGGEGVLGHTEARATMIYTHVCHAPASRKYLAKFGRSS